MLKLNPLSRAIALGVTSFSLLSSFTILSSLSNISFKNSFLPQLTGHGSVANAAEVKQYVPPSDRSRPQRTEGSGSRGCTNSVPVSLNLLTPNDHIAQTVSGRPTFFWYVSNAANVPMEFSLVEPGATQPIFQQQLKVDKAGIVKVEIPANVSELAVGKQYRWTVALLCSQKRPSENIYARAWIERASISPVLNQKLAAAGDDRDRALVYAQSGIWQDAVATLYKFHLANPGERQALDMLNTLLKQVGVAQVAANN
ncbi:DUF928 domain-containing protein [Argonema antarcticum]|uniref:DUF928 domain-containing protein n=1 Tax=Argonema antarcticum TaxID=2942763 RepID=UPI0020133698|nr:DUF928 domain-containing protein [Argonema antarcticum]MCL1473205.1 DUF928 domain-containing protein [Argonema antarcticum A004/B2]